MKTKEFIRRLSMFAGTYGMRVSQSDDYNYITLETDDSLKLEVLCVETKAYFSVNSIEIAFEELPHLAKQEVMNDIIFPYISTPLEKREEEKRYQINIINDVVKFNSRGSYLNLRVDTGQYMISDSKETSEFKTQFTQKEINNFPDDVKEILPLCKQIEVTP